MEQVERRDRLSDIRGIPPGSGGGEYFFVSI